MGQLARAIGVEDDLTDRREPPSQLAQDYCRTCERFKAWTYETDGRNGYRVGCEFCRLSDGRVCADVYFRHVRSGTKPDPQCPSPYLSVGGPDG